MMGKGVLYQTSNQNTLQTKIATSKAWWYYITQQVLVDPYYLIKVSGAGIVYVYAASMVQVGE